MLLWHMTTKERAEAIMACGHFVSRENDHAVYFSNRPDGETDGFGEWFVLVDVAEQDARLDDEFPDGEQHYAVRASDISTSRILRAGPVAALPATETPAPTARQAAVRDGFPTTSARFPKLGEWLAVRQAPAGTRELCLVFHTEAAARRYLSADLTGVVTFGRYGVRSLTGGLVREATMYHNGKPTTRTIRKAMTQS